MKQRRNINIMEGGIKYAGGQGEGSGPMLLVTQFSFTVQEISGLHLRYLCKKTQDQTIFFLVFSVLKISSGCWDQKGWIG